MTIPWAGKTILIVDDSELIRKQLTLLYETFNLKIAGYAKNGVEALEAYDRLHPDIVSMDIIMPEMHGLNCYAELKKSDPNIKLLFVSCLVVNHIITDDMLAEIPRELFISKPPDNRSIQHALELLFGLHSTQSNRPQPEKTRNTDKHESRPPSQPD
ncbi:MAG: response regulator [Deltaproteobacteria bacterium]|nr:response regulator [Deltaproteobacteria bacterium]